MIQNKMVREILITEAFTLQMRQIDDIQKVYDVWCVVHILQTESIDKLIQDSTNSFYNNLVLWEDSAGVLWKYDDSSKRIKLLGIV